MNEEISHIAQWQELSERAANFKMELTFDSEKFTLSTRIPAYVGNVRIAERFWAKKTIGTYTTLADLRAGISDYVAQERQAGRMMR